jgi:hypothetical protein
MRTNTWMFAALNTVEPPILDLQTTRFLEGDKAWFAQRLPFVEEFVTGWANSPVVLAMPTGSLVRSALAIC